MRITPNAETTPQDPSKFVIPHSQLMEKVFVPVILDINLCQAKIFPGCHSQKDVSGIFLAILSCLCSYVGHGCCWLTWLLNGRRIAPCWSRTCACMGYARQAHSRTCALSSRRHWRRYLRIIWAPRLDVWRHLF
jgi:hypothetical protein